MVNKGKAKISKRKSTKAKIKKSGVELPKFKKSDPLYKMQGECGILMTKDGRHVKERFKVKQRKEVNGKVVLELTPLKPLAERRKELIGQLSKVLSEKIDNKELMKDILDDVATESLEKLQTAVDRGAEIKPREGCFFLQIKDPRKKKPYNLSIRK